jgi:cation:H+ antiporter
MLSTVIIFILALFLLLVAANYFTLSAEKIGLALKLSPFFVGVVIVALGTSLPEMVSSILSMVQGHSEIVSGNIIGANVSNLFLILGITTLVSKRSIKLGEEYIFIDLHFMLGGILMATYFMWDGFVSWGEGVFLLIGCAVYQIHFLHSEKPDVMRAEEMILSLDKKVKPEWKTIAVLVLSGLGVFLGAKYTVESIVEIAEYLNVSKSIISITALSLGTTLPELSVSITAVRRGNPQIAIGNILGSCIFNTFSVLGVSSMLGTIVVPASHKEFLLLTLLTAGLFFYLVSQDKKISMWEGMLFLLFYMIFIYEIVGRV